MYWAEPKPKVSGKAVLHEIKCPDLPTWTEHGRAERSLVEDDYYSYDLYYP